MNQLVGRDEKGNPILILVLEPGNVHKMTVERKPVDMRVEDMFPQGIPRTLRLVIAHSETPVADAKEFARFAKMTLDERTPIAKTKVPHCPECHTTIEQLGVWRNESPMALTFCVGCGCVFGMVPSEVAKFLPSAERKEA